MSDVDRFLTYIGQLESSGGKNTNHEPTASGQVAQGTYGLLPSTQEELAGRYPASEETSPDEAARYLAQHVLKRAGGDEQLAAGMWRHGHNSDVSNPDVADRLRQSSYAQAYTTLRNNDIPQALDPNLYGDRLRANKEGLASQDNTLMGKPMLKFPAVRKLVTTK